MARVSQQLDQWHDFDRLRRVARQAAYVLHSTLQYQSSSHEGQPAEPSSAIMAPLPPIWDPAKAQDRLPQPYRMIDKVLAEIVEKALDTCLAKEKQKRVIDATHIDTVQHH